MKKTILSILTLVSLSSGVCAQNVTIPDANFKAYLVGQPTINTNGDTEIQVSEASAVNAQITCQNQSISDLTGIEAFTSLTSLNCSNNSLSSLDVSQNTALTSLSFNNNSLTGINVSQNTALTTLFCLNNSLTSLDLSQNTALSALNCSGNALTSLDLSQNTSLTGLYCNSNSLSSLDVSNNTSLNEFSCGGSNSLASLDVANGNNLNFIFFEASQSPSLTCIQVDDVNYSTANWTNIDGQTSFSNNCSGSTASLTESEHKQFLIYPNPAQDQIFIETTEAQFSQIDIIDLSGKVIQTYGNPVKSIDVSDLTPGVYMIKIYTENEISTQRFIKQ